MTSSLDLRKTLKMSYHITRENRECIIFLLVICSLADWPTSCNYNFAIDAFQSDNHIMEVLLVVLSFSVTAAVAVAYSVGWSLTSFLWCWRMFLSRITSGEGSGIRLYRFLFIAVSSTLYISKHILASPQLIIIIFRQLTVLTITFSGTSYLSSYLCIKRSGCLELDVAWNSQVLHWNCLFVWVQYLKCQYSPCYVML